MSERVVVPEGMLEAFLGAKDYALHVEDRGNFGGDVEQLEAALDWLDGELAELKTYEGDGYWQAGYAKAIEHVRRIYIAPEPSSPEDEAYRRGRRDK